jgi:hypothetical protein
MPDYCEPETAMSLLRTLTTDDDGAAGAGKKHEVQ